MKALSKTQELTRFRNRIVLHDLQDVPMDACNVIARYYPGIQQANEYASTANVRSAKPLFEPSHELPFLNSELINFFSPARINFADTLAYKNRLLKILDLHGDPETNTVKSIASLVLVARAISHIKSTGENVLILVPTSGNKGTALRRAVERALDLQLVTKHQLRVVMIVPYESRGKLRKSKLSERPEWRALNPIFVYKGQKTEEVKQVGLQFQQEFLEYAYRVHNTRIWYSLESNNYSVPESLRAFYEHEYNLLNYGSHESSHSTLQAHAVSSGYGLLGYHLGKQILINNGLIRRQDIPGYFLVQHLATPGMVLYNYYHSFDKKNVPEYHLDQTSGLWTQNKDIHFPLHTFSVDESIDPTFYTSTPQTAVQLTEMINLFGGGGIIVSLYECMEKYSQIAQLLMQANILLPKDPRKIQEWALIMVMTGVLNGIDRQIIPERTKITIHYSGYWTDEDFTPLCSIRWYPIDRSTSLNNIKSIIFG
jgi:hypothetical protein